MSGVAEWAQLLSDHAGLALSSEAGRRALARYVASLPEEARESAWLGAGTGASSLADALDAVTVPHTWLFRDAPHLEALRDWLRAQPRDRPLDVWVPGCASGEDAYSIAALGLDAAIPLRVFGTDLNRGALARAQAGLLTVRPELPLPPAARFLEIRGARARPSQLLAEQVHFARHNLFGWPPRPPGREGWDAIVCRNVLIYFEHAAIKRVLEQLTLALRPGGRVLFGPNDVFLELPAELDPTPRLGRILLERRGGAPAAASSPQPPAQARPAVHAAPRPTIAAAPAPEKARDIGGILASGHARWDRGDLEGALRAYREAVARAPVDPEPRLLVGVVERQRGALDAAVQTLRGALFLGPRVWPASYYLARTLDELGRHDEAAREYARLLSLDLGKVALRHQGGPLGDVLAFRDEIAARARQRVRDT